MKPIALALMLALSACATTPDTNQARPAIVETGKTTLGVLGWLGIVVILPLAVMGVF